MGGDFSCGIDLEEELFCAFLELVLYVQKNCSGSNTIGTIKNMFETGLVRVNECKS